MTDRLKERLRNRLEREASHRNSAYDRFGMDNTPQSVDPDVFEALDRITQLEAEVERLALRYEEQSKFADPDYAAHFRDFARQLRAALHQGDRKP